ncbi:MAG: hypothetical protein HN348_23560, partial [Proteobacteria bacterium]|nr:hypothetical protein [Pseudomonadota bacterium]
KRFAVPRYAVEDDTQAVEWLAAGPNEMSGPLDEVQHGAFTYVAIGAMRGWADGQLDGIRDGQVTAEEAQLYVSYTLRTMDIRDQTPTMKASDTAELVLSTGVVEIGPSFDAPKPEPQPDVIEVEPVSAPAPPIPPSPTVKPGTSQAALERAAGLMADPEAAQRELLANTKIVIPGVGWHGIIIGKTDIWQSIGHLEGNCNAMGGSKGLMPCSKLREKPSRDYSSLYMYKSSVYFSVLGGHALRVNIDYDGIRTPEGLGVGSTIDEFRSAYGEPPQNKGGHTFSWPDLGFHVIVNPTDGVCNGMFFAVPGYE